MDFSQSSADSGEPSRVGVNKNRKRPEDTQDTARSRLSVDSNFGSIDNSRNENCNNVSYVDNRVDSSVNNSVNYTNNINSTAIYNNGKTEEEKKQEEREHALKWLCEINFWAKQIEVFGRRTPGTGEWFLNHPLFVRWLQDTGHTLFCYGIPGAGKTVLASVAIDHLERNVQADGQIGIAFIYCDYRHQSTQHAANLISSILYQLVFSREDSEAYTSIVMLYAVHSRKGTRPSLTDYLQALEAVIRTFARVFIVIDALDELSSTEGPILIQGLKHLSKLELGVNVLITSRPENCIKGAFQDAIQLEILARDDDMKRYLTLEAQNRYMPVKGIKREGLLTEHVIGSIIRKSKGMFLVAKFYLDMLETAYCDNDVDATLQNLPEGLDAVYDNIIKRIESQGTKKLALAKRALTWVTFAQRALTIEVLRLAVAINDGDTKLDKGSIPWADVILSVCAGLIVIDENGGEVRLVHYTTQDYLQRWNTDFLPSPHTKIAATCLTYFSFERELKPLEDSQGSEHPYLCNWPQAPNCWKFNSLLQHYYFDASTPEAALLCYAAIFWANHARRGSLKDTQKQIFDFLKSKRLVTGIVVIERLHGRLSLFGAGTRNLDCGEIESFSSPIILMLRIGLEELAVTLLRKGKPLDARAGSYFLRRAVKEYGYNEGTVNWLLTNQNGVDIEARDSHGKTVLFNAITRAWVGTARLLLEHNANIEAQDSQKQTPLFHAIVCNNLDVVRLLLEHNANTDARDSVGRTPLNYALTHSGIDVVQLLLEHNANIEARDSHGKTVLFDAIACNNLDVVRLLLEHNANIEAQDSQKQTPLFCAIRHGRIGVVRLLLEHGANIEAGGLQDRTPLSHAVTHSGIDVVQLLLEHNANIEARDSHGKTVLFDAIACNNLDVVRLLLEHNANIEAQDLQKRTPLFCAIRHGRIGVVRLLLEHGANIEAGGLQDRTPLSRAITHSGIDVVQLLLEHNANIEARDSQGRTPLSHAVMYAHVEIGVVRLLLEHNANIEAQDIQKQTPLFHAITCNNHEVIRLLLEYNARIEAYIEAQDSQKQTPLFHAITSNNLGVVRLLLEHNANIEARDSQGRTPLTHAITWNNHEDRASLFRYWRIDIVRLLIEHNANIEAQDSQKHTPLFHAITYGRINLVRLLCKHNANIEARDSQGRTPLSHAIIYNNLEAVQLLLEHKTNIEAQDSQKQTPLFHAITHGRIDIVRLLLKHNANIETRDSQGRTPLIHAIACSIRKQKNDLYQIPGGLKRPTKFSIPIRPLLGWQVDIEIIKVLLEKGASIEATDPEGVTPISLAKRESLWSVVELIEQEKQCRESV